jgi:2-desacetyl-2-hydroxyethyl bacteriochlorophyllide A dehydrogenase
MQSCQILFTQPNVAELVPVDVIGPSEREVLVETECTALSAGTERANLIGEVNISGAQKLQTAHFPRALGYSGVGRVAEVGAGVTSVSPGDRVLIYYGKHILHNVVPEAHVLKIPYDDIPSTEAAFVVISLFSMLGVRTTRLEFGESALVMGLGMLGLYAVQIAQIAGAYPVIAADPNPARRTLAREVGADVALNPMEKDFMARIRTLTADEGVRAVIEVTGVAAAYSQALEAAARFGRVSLLGCTRDPIDQVDFYHQVHFPGVTLVGANNWARPVHESRPGCWTYRDDALAMLNFIHSGRFHMGRLISEIHSPKDAPEVYRRLAFEYSDFPIGVAFDWTRL